MLFCTYNMHYGVGADDRYDVARIADAVAQADIVCLQEIVRGWPQLDYTDQSREIGTRLNRYFRFHGPMEADASSVGPDGRIINRRRSFGNTIVSRWPIAWSRGVMLPKTRLLGAFDLQRGYIEAVVAAPSGPLRIYCTHLSHVGPSTRLPQVEALMQAIKRAPLTGPTWDMPVDKGHLALPAIDFPGSSHRDQGFLLHEPVHEVPAAAIVAGDFNFQSTDPEYALICGAPSELGPRTTPLHLVDAWFAAGNGDQGVESFPGEGRIDHVFVTPDLTAKVKRAWIDHDTPASDHWPVFVEFDL